MREKARFERRRFLEMGALGALLLGVDAAISNCSSSSDKAATPSGPADVSGSVAGNHGHAAVITAAQITAAAGVTLDIKGTADHTHSLALSAADVKALAARQPVTVTSAAGGSGDHTHAVTFTPAAATSSGGGGGW